MLSDYPTDNLQLSIETGKDISHSSNENGLIFMKEESGLSGQNIAFSSFNDSIEQAAIMAAIEAVEENSTTAAHPVTSDNLLLNESTQYNQNIELDEVYRGGVLGFPHHYHQPEEETPYSPATAKLTAVPILQSNKASSRSSSSRHSGRVCVICYSTDSTSWLKDKTREGAYNCLKCYQKKSRTGPVKDVLPDGTTVQRTCTRCEAQDTSRWHRDIIHDEEVNGVVRPAFICGKCKYKVRKSREAPPPIDGRSRRVDRKGGMVPYYMPSPNNRASKKQTTSVDEFELNSLNLIMPPNTDFMYNLPVSAERFDDL